jgi:hypothetical protein
MCIEIYSGIFILNLVFEMSLQEVSDKVELETFYDILLKYCNTNSVREGIKNLF